MRDGHSTRGLIKSLLDPGQDAPYSACMDAICEQIELLCLEGSEYMRFLRIDCCQEILLQPNWLAVDGHSQDRTVLGSMCIALIPLLGFSDNGLEDLEFYNSIWVQLWRLSSKNDTQLHNTILYAIQAAHPHRLLPLFKSLRLWYTTNYQEPKGKIKLRVVVCVCICVCAVLPHECVGKSNSHLVVRWLCTSSHFSIWELPI